MSSWVDVLVDCPGLDGLFTYSVPLELHIQAGDVVVVPFGRQNVSGIVLNCQDTAPDHIPLEKVKPVLYLVATGFFTREYWQILEKVADYYHCDLLAVIRCALPPAILAKSQFRLRLKENENFEIRDLSPEAKQILEMLQTGKSYSLRYLKSQIKEAEQSIVQLSKLAMVESFLEFPKAPKPKLQKAVILISCNNKQSLTLEQQKTIDLILSNSGQMWLSELLDHALEIKQLVKSGYLLVENREKLRMQSGLSSSQIEQTKNLNLAQQKALDHINKIEGYREVLLHGVTGSGKTEIYLQAIASKLDRGLSCLVLVPEIGLTPQLTDRFLARFPGKVWIYHSGLSQGERYDTWRHMLENTPQIIIGTRSAIFAPLPKLGIIILDEEHDSSFKQSQSSPTYDTHKVAQLRAQAANCPLVLASATPSLETWHCAQIGQADYLSLPQRIGAKPLPSVTIVDLAAEFLSGNRSMFSRHLSNALENLNGKQAILFINRRGHSTFVGCRACGKVLECPNCDVSLAYHLAENSKLLRCHYCNYSTYQPQDCPECSSPYLKYFGSGTQKVTQELSKRFPRLKTIRFDSDTTSNKDAHRKLLTQFAQGEADILVGTQMLSKGLDIHNVTLVGIVSADGLLHHCDYRANERAFQTLSQVAGRAGRGDSPGRVIIQTYNPQHRVIRAVANHDYQGFIQIESQERDSLGFPPYGLLTLLRLSGENESLVQSAAEDLADFLGQISQCEILGPAPANIPRVANRYHWQILLKFVDLSQRNQIDWQSLKKKFSNSSVNLIVEVDP
ncbi:MAG: primosomal protein N' [Cyanobacteriota bacterium ELA615]